MADRRITFTDVDENPLVVWLKEDRVQLFVVDSRPELEAGELRGFALALFAKYVGGELVARLESAREKIGGVRDALASTAAADALLAALEGSLSAIADVQQVMSAADAASAPVCSPEPAPPPPEPASLPEPTTCSILPLTAGGWRRKPTRGKPVREDGAPLGWGWARVVPVTGISPGSVEHQDDDCHDETNDDRGPFDDVKRDGPGFAWLLGMGSHGGPGKQPACHPGGMDSRRICVKSRGR